MSFGTNFSKCVGESDYDFRGLSPYSPGLDGRTSCTEGYKISPRKRKRVEEIFGWLKTVGGMRKTRFIGEARTWIAAYLSAAPYNLLRVVKLQCAGSAA